MILLSTRMYDRNFILNPVLALQDLLAICHLGYHLLYDYYLRAIIAKLMDLEREFTKNDVEIIKSKRGLRQCLTLYSPTINERFENHSGSSTSQSFNHPKLFLILRIKSALICNRCIAGIPAFIKNIGISINSTFQQSGLFLLNENGVCFPKFTL